MAQNTQEDFMDYDEDIDYFDDDDDEEVCGYHCLCCGSTIAPHEVDEFGNRCPRCTSSALDKIYF